MITVIRKREKNRWKERRRKETEELMKTKDGGETVMKSEKKR